MRFGRLLAIGLLAVAFCGLHSEAGKKKGKGGGGGGGDPPAPPPAGTIYFNIAGDGIYAMDGNGDNLMFVTEPLGGGGGPPSHQLHDGMRWWLTGRNLAGTLADGKPPRELIAKREDGLVQVLYSDPTVRVGGPSLRRWAKDDSFAGLGIVRPADGTSALLTVDTDWSTGVPAAGAVSVVVEGTYDTRFGALQSSFQGFDWSPDATQLAYEDKLADWPFVELKVLDLDAGTTQSLGEGRSGARWSPDGSRIAFVGGLQNQTRISTVKPDGSDLVRATAAEGDTSNPEWSPEGIHIAFMRTITTGKGKKAKTAREILRVPETGGSEVILTGDVTPGVSVRSFGWR